MALSDVDHRGDIYSLGMTMYQMLAGRMPFDEGSSTLTILKAVDEQRIPPPNKFNPEVPAPLVNIIMRAIKKDRNERFQSAREMIDAIERFESGELDTPPPEATKIFSPADRTQLFTRPPDAKAPSKKPAVSSRPKVKATAAKGNSSSGKKGLLIGIAAAVLLAAAGGYYFFGTSDDMGTNTPSMPTTTDGSQPSPTEGSTDPIAQAGTAAGNEQTPDQPPVNPTENGPSGNDQPANTQNPNTQTPAPAPQNTTASRQSIRITSSPSGARVLLDGRAVGTTPLPLNNLDARNYTVELSLAGHAPWTRTFNPSAQSQLSATLSPLEGTVRVVVRPYGNIAINGQSHASNTNAAYETKLAAGNHLVEATHPVLGKWEKRIAVTAGESMDVLFNFNETFDITVISNPINAEIFIDGASTNRYTPSNISLRPGNHTISVRKAGYKTVAAKNIILEKQLSSPIEFTLEADQ